MARSPALKVFRTPVGFHDAYVAAPSQRAALAAFGSEKDLFSTGAAERIKDPELVLEPLANPGKVILKLRGTIAQHLAALPSPNRPQRKTGKAVTQQTTSTQRRKTTGKSDGNPAVKRRAKPVPRPDRSQLETAEAELASADARHKRELRALAKRQADLAREHHKLEAEQKRERDRLQRKLESARDKHDQAVKAWLATLS